MEAASHSRRPALGFIFVTLVLAVLGMGLVMPVLPGLITQMEGGDVSAGSHTFGWIVGVFALMQFVASPILGALSDRFGRRRVLLIATAGSAIDYVILALAPNLTWLFIGRIVAGLTAAVIATANAYIVDVTPPEKRAQSFGFLGAAFGLGFVIGPALGGWLGHIDLRLPFWAAAVFSALNWLFGLFVLPESLRPENRRAFEWRRANPVGALAALRRIPAVRGLAETHFVTAIAQMMVMSSWVLYTSYRYGWSPDTVGASLALVGVSSALVQALFTRRILAVLSEPKVVLLGYAISLIANLCYGLAPVGWMVFAIILFGAFSGISTPAMQSYITRHVAADEQGAVQGALAALMSIAGIVGPPLATWSFGWAIKTGRGWQLPGIAFFEVAALMALAWVLAARSFAAHRGLSGHDGRGAP